MANGENTLLPFDQQAHSIWRRYSGVEYVLSIRLSLALRTRQYQFEHRDTDGHFPYTDYDNNAGQRVDVLPIDHNGILLFDAHRLLGLPAHARIPAGLNNPVLLNLFGQVELIRQDVAE